VASVDQAGFFQDAPRLRDEWEDDLVLRRYLERSLPPEVPGMCRRQDAAEFVATALKVSPQRLRDYIHPRSSWG
jgi:hypothetical protein